MNKKHIINIICVLFVVVSGILFFLRNYNSDDEILLEDVMQESAIVASEDISVDGSEIDKDKLEDEEESTNKDNFDDGYIYVHICGAVVKPGVYKLDIKSRVVDVIKMAGGLTSKADSVAINQAKLLSDSEQIYIPNKGEKLTVDSGLSNVSNKDNSQDNDESNNSQNKVNINSASKSDLITLPGIGEAKADTIIEYRNKNGSFSKIEDLMNITGIKEGLFNKISEYITV